MSKLRDYPRTFWVANSIEIFERMAWYGFFTLSSLYITGSVSDGCLGFTSEQRGILQGVITFILYLLPVLTGALADKYGFKKMLALAFIILAPGYYLLGQITSFWGFFAAFLLVALGAALFKPSLLGTIAKTTDEKTSSFGWGIFYMMVNLGGFFGPIVAGILRGWNWKWIFIMSTVWICVNLILLTFLYKEPPRPLDEERRTLKKVLSNMVAVLGNGRLFLTVFIILVLLIVTAKKWLSGTNALITIVSWVLLNLLIDIPLKSRCKKSPNQKSWLVQPMRLGNWQFALFLIILSGFWTIYNQVFMTLPEYIRDFINTKPILIFLRDTAGLFGFSGILATLNNAIETNYQINPEFIININPLAIIVLQIFVTWIFLKRKPLFTITSGIIIASISMLLLALGASGWLVALSILIFSIGEMATSPKSQEYIALIAPKDKVALFMGYYFVAVALGNLFGGLLSGTLYGWLARDLRRPDLMWMTFVIMAVVVALLFVLYNRFVIRTAKAGN